MTREGHRPIRIVRDGRILNALANRYPLEWDKTYKYITKYNDIMCKDMEYKGKRYGLIFFDGCFNPFVAEKYTD